jgi:hypothetical protein
MFNSSLARLGFGMGKFIVAGLQAFFKVVARLFWKGPYLVPMVGVSNTQIAPGIVFLAEGLYFTIGG